MSAPKVTNSSIFSSPAVPEEEEKKPVMYRCRQGTCDRLFRSEQNADQHFCWNVTPYVSLPKETRLRRKISSLILKDK